MTYPTYPMYPVGGPTKRFRWPGIRWGVLGGRGVRPTPRPHAPPCSLQPPMLNVQQLFKRLYPLPPADAQASPVAALTPPRASRPHLRPPAPPPLKRHLPGFLPTPPQAEWVAEWRKGPQMVLPPVACSCGGQRFWTPSPTTGPYVCIRCHAPPFPDCAARHLELVFVDERPHIKVLALDTSSTLK